MDLIATFLGGLGLFLAGVRGLGAGLQALAGRRLRQAVARATRGGAGAALTGAALGALTQSSNAVTIVAASLVQAGIMPLARALPVVAWCNLGTAALVLAAALDLRVAALWLLGLAGCALALGPAGGRWRTVPGAAFQLGLLFLGLAILKAGAAPLRDSAALRDAMALAGHGLFLPFAVGAAVTLLAQSSSTVTILVVALAETGLLDGAQAGAAVCGASLGSGLSVLLLARGLRGAARRLATFQVLFKALGAGLLLLPFLLWRTGPLPGFLDAMDLPHRLGLLFVAIQLVPALLAVPLHPWLPALLERLSPATAEEALSRPRYLYDGALEDPPTALDLAAREQARLLGRLPALLDAVREDAASGTAPLPPATLSAASALVERAVEAFLQEVLGRGCPREELGRAVALKGLNGLLTALRETTGDFATLLGSPGARSAEAAVGAFLPPLAEALHLLLSELHEAAGSGDPADARTLAELAADRSGMMDGLRRRVARATPPQEGLDLLFRATALFERAVWLVRRAALILAAVREDAAPT